MPYVGRHHFLNFRPYLVRKSESEREKRFEDFPSIFWSFAWLSVRFFVRFSFFFVWVPSSWSCRSFGSRISIPPPPPLQVCISANVVPTRLPGFHRWRRLSISISIHPDSHSRKAEPMVSHPGRINPLALTSPPCNRGGYSWRMFEWRLQSNSFGFATDKRTRYRVICTRCSVLCTDRGGYTVPRFLYIACTAAHGGPVQFSSGGSHPHHYRCFSLQVLMHLPSGRGNVLGNSASKATLQGPVLPMRAPNLLKDMGALNVQRSTLAISHSMQRLSFLFFPSFDAKYDAEAHLSP